MTDREVPRAVVARIVQQGLRQPVTMGGLLRQLWGLGPGVLFFGTGLRVVLALAVSGLVGSLFSAPASLGLLFAFAPVLLLTLVGFVESAQRFGPVAELRGTLRHTGTQLAAFRMLVFGVVGLVFGTALAVATSRSGSGVGTAVAVAALSVGGAAALTLTVLRRWHPRWLGSALVLAWVGGWLIVARLLGSWWDAALAAVPGLLAWLLASLAFAGFGWQVRRLLLDGEKTEVFAHAAG